MHVAMDVPRFVLRPKRHGGFRRFTILPPALSTRFDRVVAEVTPAIAAASVHGAIGPYSGASGSTGRALLRTGLADLAATGRDVAVTDVAAFYPSTAPTVVEHALAGVHVQSRRRRDIRAMLEELAELGVEGLPIGPRGSAVLAHAVLLPVDRLLVASGAPWLRWVDDIAFAPRSDRDLDRGAEDIVETLQSLGLGEHIRKRRVLPATQVRDGWLGSVSYHRIDADPLSRAARRHHGPPR